jgi:segregation and condensation protein A
LHVARTTVREQVEILAGRLASLRRATFRQLSSDSADTYEVVARFLAVLELYRSGSVSFDQLAPLGELYVTWAADGRRSADGHASENGRRSADGDLSSDSHLSTEDQPSAGPGQEGEA